MRKVKEVFKEFWIYIVLIILIILVKLYIVTPVKVNGTSMIDTLHDNDIMILNKLSYKFSNIKRFDIVVIDDKEELIIKRVIGLPGEYIEYKNNKLYVNGKHIKEDFSHKNTEDFSINELEATVIPDDCYFVLGDNRVNSKDSRIIGFIPKEQILGKTTLTIFPFNRLGNKE